MEAQDLVRDLVDRGFTQEQIAVYAGLGQGAVSKILRGDVKDVLSKTYRKLLAMHSETRPKRRRAVVSA